MNLNEKCKSIFGAITLAIAVAFLVLGPAAFGHDHRPKTKNDFDGDGFDNSEDIFTWIPARKHTASLYHRAGLWRPNFLTNTFATESSQLRRKIENIDTCRQMDEYESFLDNAGILLGLSAAVAAAAGQGFLAGVLAFQSATLLSYASNASSAYRKQCVEEKNRLRG